MRRIGDADDEIDLFDEADDDDLGNDFVTPTTAQVAEEVATSNLNSGDPEIVHDDASPSRHGRGLISYDAEAMAEESAMAVRTVGKEGDWLHDRFEALTVDGDEPEKRVPMTRRGRGRGYYRQSNRMGQSGGDMNGEFGGGSDSPPMDNRRGSRGVRRGARGWQRRGRGGQRASGGLPYYSAHDDRVIIQEPVYSDEDGRAASPARNKMVDEDTGQFPPWREEVGTRGAFRGQSRGRGRGGSRGGGRPPRNYVDEPVFFDQGYNAPPDDRYFQPDNQHYFDGGSNFNTVQHFHSRQRGGRPHRAQMDMYETFGGGQEQRPRYNAYGRGPPPRGMDGRGGRGEHTSTFHF
eukprot:Lankesteria_metandrocarpae@DN4473_c0_g1_i1.p1